MGKKNCELAADDIQRICDAFLAFEETPQSKIFPNAAFGYWKVKVERPLRLHSQLTRQRIETLRFASGDEDIRAALYANSATPSLSNPPPSATGWKTHQRLGQRRQRRRRRRGRRDRHAQENLYLKPRKRSC
jgi:hypothetical protein